MLSSGTQICTVSFITLVSKLFFEVVLFFGCEKLNFFVAFIFILWFVCFNKWPYIKKL